MVKFIHLRPFFDRASLKLRRSSKGYGALYELLKAKEYIMNL